MAVSQISGLDICWESNSVYKSFIFVWGNRVCLDCVGAFCGQELIFLYCGRGGNCIFL